MTYFDNPGISLCAFGAGVAHMAALALVLPLMITLPALDNAAPSKPVAIRVHIVTALAAVAPAPSRDPIAALLMPEASPDQTALQDLSPREAAPREPAPQEITPGAAVPEIVARDVEDGTPEDATPEFAALPEDALPGDVAPDQASPEDVQLDDVTGALPSDLPDDNPGDEDSGEDAVANLVPAGPPAPLPLRKPRYVPEPPRAKQEAVKPAPAPRAITIRPKPRPVAKSTVKRPVLGGRQATTMPEYPSPAQPFGGPD